MLYFCQDDTTEIIDLDVKRRFRRQNDDILTQTEQYLNSHSFGGHWNWRRYFISLTAKNVTILLKRLKEPRASRDRINCYRARK